MGEEVAAALDGRPLVAPSNRTRGRCRRCLYENDLRERAGLPTADRDPTFEDGERVRLDAVVSPADAAAPREHRWSVTAVSHRDHPQRPRSAVARRGTVQARLLATVRAEGWVYRVPRRASPDREYDPDALVVHDPRVEWVSPADEGRVRDDSDGEPGGFDWPHVDHSRRHHPCEGDDD